MCLIIDTSVAYRVVDVSDRDFDPVREALGFGRQILIVGGRLRREYLRYRAITRFVAELDRGGRARIVPDPEVDRETVIVEGLDVCESNDSHVIALARVTGARLLCTMDDAAAADFKKKSLIDHPRGKVYKTRRHRHLLSEGCGHC